MRVAILSAGPSLLKTWRGNNRYTWTIAVNSALKLFRTDWLAAGDPPTLRRLGNIRPFVGVWTMAGTIKDRPEGWESVRMLPFDYLPGWADLKRVASWSVQAAVAGAHSIGADAIDVYGHDMAGVEDVAGFADDGRCEERWKRERLDWQSTEEWAASVGIEVNRIMA